MLPGHRKADGSLRHSAEMVAAVLEKCFKGEFSDLSSEEKATFFHFLKNTLPVVSEKWKPDCKRQDLAAQTTRAEFALGCFTTDKCSAKIVPRGDRNAKRPQGETREKRAEKKARIENHYNEPKKKFKKALDDNKDVLRELSVEVRKHFAEVYGWKDSASAGSEENQENGASVVGNTVDSYKPPSDGVYVGDNAWDQWFREIEADRVEETLLLGSRTSSGV